MNTMFVQGGWGMRKIAHEQREAPACKLQLSREALITEFQAIGTVHKICSVNKIRIVHALKLLESTTLGFESFGFSQDERIYRMVVEVHESLAISQNFTQFRPEVLFGRSNRTFISSSYLT